MTGNFIDKESLNLDVTSSCCSLLHYVGASKDCDQQRMVSSGKLVLEGVPLRKVKDIRVTFQFTRGDAENGDWAHIELPIASFSNPSYWNRSEREFRYTICGHVTLDCDEKAKKYPSGQDSAQFNDLNLEQAELIIHDKQFMKTIQGIFNRSSTENISSSGSITSNSFYGIPHRDSNKSKSSTESDKSSSIIRRFGNHLFEEFFKQEKAFNFFDKLSAAARENAKVYSFECPESGQRRFVVADLNSVLEYYRKENISPNNRHIYEIIRENFPCRGYFDLEFPLSEELDEVTTNQLLAQGKRAVSLWIQLVSWKMYEIFHIELDACNFIVLDSSTTTKFSKHIIVRVLSSNLAKDSSSFLNRSTARRTSLKRRRDTNEVCAQPGDEILYQNNLEIAYLIESILLDITELYAEPQISSSLSSLLSSTDYQNSSTSIVINPPINRRHPKLAYRDLWFPMKGEDKKAFIVDLGVYSRNRAFRIYGCCKFKKTARLHVNKEDSLFYKGLVMSDPYQETQLALQTSFVISDDVCKRYTYDTIARRPQSSSPSVVRLSTPVSSNSAINFIGSPSAFEKLSSGSAQYHFKGVFITYGEAMHARHLFLARDFGTLHSNGFLGSSSYNGSYRNNHSCGDIIGSSHGNLAPRNSSVDLNWRESIVLDCKQSFQCSPFPKIDEYILKNCANVGGVQGALGGWTIYRTSLKDSTSSPVLHRLRYQILHNHWCRRIGRPHKSNHIILEVDLFCCVVTQLCWDPECRGYRSEPSSIDKSLICSELAFDGVVYQGV